MTLRVRRRFRRTVRGDYDVNLPPDERALLRALPEQLASSLDDSVSAGLPDGSPVRRLFPTAHPRDDAAEADYVERHRASLLRHHREVLQVLADTADAKRMTSEQLEDWLGALNDLRLALGTTLSVSEEPVEPDPDAPDYADWVCYHYLSFLQTELIEVLSGVLPPPAPGAGEHLPEDPWGEPLGGLRWDGTPLPDGDL